MKNASQNLLSRNNPLKMDCMSFKLSFSKRDGGEGVHRVWNLRKASVLDGYSPIE